MFAPEAHRKLKRSEWLFRVIGTDAVALPFGSRPEASIHDGAPHWVDMDLMPGEIVSAANHELPLPKFNLPVAKEAGGIQAGQTQSNPVKPVKPVRWVA
jgi:hypothetical protein